MPLWARAACVGSGVGWRVNAKGKPRFMALALHPPPSRDRVARLRTVYGRHSASRRGGVRRKRGRGGRDAREGQDIATAYPHAARPRSLANRYAMAATIGAMRPAPAELKVAQALIARVKAADPSLKRVDELLVCAAQSHVAMWADELGGVPDFALGRWARTSRGRSR